MKEILKRADYTTRVVNVKPIINIKKLNEHAVLPSYGSEYAAGADLYAIVHNDTNMIEILPSETAFIGTGLSMEIPEGYVGLIYARSGMACKRGLAPANKVGVIDSDYRGEIMVALYNHSGEAVTVSKGERIAQLVLAPFITADFTEADSLEDSVRGEGGFGSTGTH